MLLALIVLDNIIYRNEDMYACTYIQPSDHHNYVIKTGAHRKFLRALDLFHSNPFSIFENIFFVICLSLCLVMIVDASLYFIIGDLR